MRIRQNNVARLVSADDLPRFRYPRLPLLQHRVLDKWVMLLANLVLLSALFPYVTPVPTSYDTQPWTLLLGGILVALLVLTRPWRELISRPILFMVGIFLLAAVVYLFRSDPWFGLRSLAAYATIPVMAIVVIGNAPRLSGKVLVFAVSVWSTVAAMQLFFNLRFAEAIVPRYAETIVRGVSSLAAEPSALAGMALLFTVLNEFFRRQGKYGQWAYVSVIAMSIFLAVASGTGTGLLFIALLIAARLVTNLVHDRALPSLTVTLGAAVFSIALVTGLPSLREASARLNLTSATGSQDGDRAALIEQARATRGKDLLVNFFNDPWNTVITDGSMGERVGHPVVAARSLASSNGLGYGLGTWNDHARSLVGDSPQWVRELFVKKFDLGGRIFSGWGTPIFELGIAGAAWVLAIILVLARPAFTRCEERPAALYGFLVLAPMLTMAVSMATPVIGLTVGLHIAAARMSSRSSESNLVQFVPVGTPAVPGIAEELAA